MGSVTSCDSIETPVESFPPLSENAQVTLRSRYLIRDDTGQITETPDEMFHRVARTVASAELQFGKSEEFTDDMERRFFNAMRSLRMLPNSPTLMNAGRSLGMLSACFCVGVPDDLEGILEGLKTTGLIQRAGGGCGFAFDELRPSGSFITSSGGTTSGPISFWRTYSELTNSIQQGAFRRGANMAMMSITAPDILKFLFAKQNLSQFTNYNISVKLTDEFMKQIDAGTPTPHQVYNFHRKEWYVIPRKLLTRVQDAVALSQKDPSKRDVLDNCYGIQDLVRINCDEPLPVGDFITVNDLWNILVTNAHQTGEPGVCFIDRIRETEPTPHIGQIVTSNPCGESFLLSGEACNLASINLDKFVDAEDVGEYKIDWAALHETVKLTVRFLDNVITVNKFPTPEIERICRSNRKIGLGVMGLADVLFKLGAPYNSKDGRTMASMLIERVHHAAMEAEVELAAERGVFEYWTNSRWEHKGIRVRNAEVMSIAPTGTISIIADCSCGIEPLFSLAFMRNVLNGKQLTEELHSFFEKVARKHGFWRDDLMSEAMAKGSIQHLDYIPERFRRIFVCAHDIAPADHVLMQATVQRFVSNSVSKTINLPHSATIDDVTHAYLLAWRSGCKAVTVYRDGSRAAQPMQLAAPEVKTPAPLPTATPIDTPSRPVFHAPPTPVICDSIRFRQETTFGHLHATVVYDPVTRDAIELFAHCGSAGGVEQADVEAICRLSSLLLRGGCPVTKLINQLSNISTSVRNNSPQQVTSFPKAIANTLLLFMEEIAKRDAAAASDSSEGRVQPAADGNGRVLSTLRSRMDEPTGYRLSCPRGPENCTGIYAKNGTCTYCVTCGASSC